LIPHFSSDLRAHARYHVAVALIGAGDMAQATEVLRSLNQVDGSGICPALPLALMEARRTRWGEALAVLDSAPSSLSLKEDQ
jgi:hypothetical protein